MAIAVAGAALTAAVGGIRGFAPLRWEPGLAAIAFLLVTGLALYAASRAAAVSRAPRAAMPVRALAMPALVIAAATVFLLATRGLTWEAVRPIAVGALTVATAFGAMRVASPPVHRTA